MRSRVLLFGVHCNLYFDSHDHFLYRSDILSVRVYYVLCMK